MKTGFALLISIALATKASADCWATRLGFPCCEYSAQVFYTDNDGKWSIENGEWCGIIENQNSNCWSAKLGYPCCKSTTAVEMSDSDGQWGVENGQWCGIQKTQNPTTQPAVTQPAITQPAVQPTQVPQRPAQHPKPDISTNVKQIYASNFNNRRFEGFGTSFCWWANRLGYSDSLAEKAATLFYDKVNGLGLTVIRYNIGGGDDPTHHHITRTDSNMPGYAINPRYDGRSYTWDYNWNSDANQRNVLLKSVAKNRDEIIVEAFSNSPPYFMTNSGCSTGNFDANKDNLKSDAYPAFAKYLADVAEHFKTSWGVGFQSITPVNEPFTNYWGANSKKQEGCHFDQGNSESKIIVELKKAIDQRGLRDMQISGTDETSIDTQITSFQKLSNEAKNIITRIDTHTYGGNSGMINLNGGYWGVAVADHDNDKIILSQKYYGFGQFSRYIRPGYTIIGCYNNSVAAYDSQGKKLVIVATNPAGTNKIVDFNLSTFTSVGYNVKVIRTSGSINNGEHWAELPSLVPYGKGFNAELKANSITTFIVDDVEW